MKVIIYFKNKTIDPMSVEDVINIDIQHCCYCITTKKGIYRVAVDSILYIFEEKTSVEKTNVISVKTYELPSNVFRVSEKAAKKFRGC